MRRLMLLVVILGVFFTGCSSGDISYLKSIEASEGEAQVSSLSMSTSDRESAVYAQISDRTLLDLTLLDEVAPEDLDSVVLFMDQVHEQLVGRVDPKQGVLQEYFVDYLLFEMQKTPYYWARESMVVLGMDSSSRSIIVDVNYVTSDKLKPVKPDSKIALGEPNYEKKMEVRLERWLNILNLKNSGKGGWEQDLEQFKSIYGDPSEILQSQRSVSLSGTMFDEQILYTYNNLVSSDNNKSNATMRVRYILTPKFVLGVNLGLECNHMYLVEYALGKDPTVNFEVYNEEGSSVITDNIDMVMHRYFRAIEGNNHKGLYNLVNNYEAYDKYFEDYFKTTYRSNGGYTITLFDIRGTEVLFGVNLSRKVRARGSYMTYPIYNERYLYTASLVDDKLVINDEVLLSSTLDGEPVINLVEADVAGFSSAISLSVDDRLALEKLIADFGVLQLSGDTTSDNFGALVDLSVPANSLTIIKENMSLLPASRKVVWLNSYLQGHSNYASVGTRDLYQLEDGSLVETSAVYEFSFRNGQWKIYNFTISDVNKLSATQLPTRNSLAVLSPSGVEEFTSKVTTPRNERTDEDDLDDIGVVYKYNVRDGVPVGGTSKESEEDDSNEGTATDITDDEAEGEETSDTEEGIGDA